MQKELFNEREISEIFGIPCRQLQKFRYIGKGPVHYKVGRSVYYRRLDIERYLDQVRQDPGGDQR